MSSIQRPSIISVVLTDKHELYKSYMSFLKNGGLFVPTSRLFNLQDEVFVFVTLPDEVERRPVSGKVAWISPNVHTTARPQGIGVQFMDTPENDSLRTQIEVLLAGIAADQPTHTM